MKVSNVSLMNGCSPLRENNNKFALKFGNNDFPPAFPDFPKESLGDTFSSSKRLGMFGQDLDDPLDPRNEDDILSPFYKSKDTFQDTSADPYQQTIEEQNRLMEDAFATSVMMGDGNPFTAF